MNLKLIFPVLFLLSSSMTTGLIAQPESKEEWQNELQQAITQRDDLKNQVEALEKSVAALKERDASLATELENCHTQLYSMLGRSEQQAKEFSQVLDQIDERLNKLARLSDVDLLAQRTEIDSLQALISRTMKRPLALIPENATRLQDQQQRLDKIRAPLSEANKHHITYIVGTWKHDRDCLWNIAAKPKIYHNPFLWPKIWEDNRGQIKNPDLIYKGQHLMIPEKAPLSAQETKLERSYWKHKAQHEKALATKS
ncbi:MAG TPA: hypothetical protein VMU30_11490 [Bacteroidota bacterium]|nr:hypothetical protein [Bacteroidota bacterium]